MRLFDSLTENIDRITELFAEGIVAASNVDIAPEANKNTAENSGVKFDIRREVNGNKYVLVNESIYDNTDGTSVASVIASIISTRFNNLIEINGQKIQINKTTNDEWTKSKSARYLIKKEPQKALDKYKAIANADEILQAANNWIGEELNHERNDDIVEFARGNVYYKVGNNGYVADVIVGIRENGNAVLYDLKNIYDKKITEAGSTAAESNRLRTRKSSVVNNVSNNTENVKKNQKNSARTDDLIKKYPNLNLNQDISSLDGVPAIRLVDGSVLPLDEFNGRRMLHVEFIQKNKIDFQDIESGGWIGNGEYEPSFTSDTQRFVERMAARKKVADLTGEKFDQFKYSTRDSEGNTLSEQQQEYFKDSKARDADGNLLVVYHGTDAEFTVFDRTKGRANMDIQGSFFSPWDIDAQGYGSNVKSYYLNITNPAPEGVAYKALNRFKGQNNAGVKAREYLESLGYDGVNNGDEEYIAFNSNQIKLIDNTAPTENEDVRYSARDYSYNVLVSKPDMQIAKVNDTITYTASSETRKKLVDDSIKKSAEIGGYNKNGNVVIHVDDVDSDIIVSKKSLTHGIDRRLQVSAPVISNIGNILKNSIKINELNPRTDDISQSYVLIGYAEGNNNNYIVRFVVNQFSNDLEKVDVLYAVNTKKKQPAKCPEVTAMLLFQLFPQLVYPIYLIMSTSIFRIFCLKMY